MKIKTLLPFFASIFYAFFSILISPGYKINFEDQNYYTPAFLQKIDSTLFTRDFLLFSSQTKYSFFDEFISFFIPNTSFFYETYFVFYFLSLVIFFIGIYLITKFLTKDFLYALLMPAIFIFIFTGTFINSLPPLEWNFSYSWTFHPRFFVTSILTFSLGLFLHKKDFWAWFIGTIGILFHSITAIPFLFFLGIFTLIEKIWKKRDFKYLFYYLLPCLGISSFFFLNENSSETFSFFSYLDGEWEMVLTQHLDYLFFLNWFVSTVIFSVLIPLFLFYALILESKTFNKKKERLINYFGGILFIFLFFYFLFFEVFHINFFLQLQFLRFFVWLKILLFIAVVFVFLKKLTQENSQKRQLIIFLALLGILMKNNYFFIFWLLSFFIFKNEKKKTIFTNWIEVLLFFIFVLSYYSVIKISDSIPYFVWKSLGFGTICILVLEKFVTFMKDLLPVILIISIYKIGKDLRAKLNFLYVGVFLSMGIIIGGYFFIKTFQNISKPLVCDFSENTCLLKKWIKMNVKKNELILLAEEKQKPESFLNDSEMSFLRNLDFSREIYFYLRNKLHKNLFVAYSDRGQGTFNRAYALEWKKRLKMADNPMKYISELEKEYRVDYIISMSPLNIDWEIIYKNSSYFVYVSPFLK